MTPNFRANTKRLLRSSCALISIGLGATTVYADGFKPTFKVEGFADLRLAFADDPVSNLDGGFGKQRFGGGGEEIRLGEVALVGSAQIAPEWSVVAHAQFNPDLVEEFDIIEGYIQYRPSTTSRWRPSLKIGAIIPETSAENLGLGWSNIYTLTNSAANTWIAEEVRPVGTELSLEWRGDDVTLSFGATAFIGNDFSTAGLSLRGFTFGDQDIGIFGGIRVPDLGAGRTDVVTRTVKETDGRIGFAIHGGFESDRFGTFNIYYLDNRGDTTETSDIGRVWNSQFLNASYNVALGSGFELAAQALFGDGFTTPTGVEAITLGTEFETISLLLSKNFGDLAVSIRGEYFDQGDISTCICPNLGEQGEAVTLSAIYRYGRHHRFLAEVIYSDSERDGGFFNQPINLKEVLTQLVYRFQF
jgi:hypothetical protein